MGLGFGTGRPQAGENVRFFYLDCFAEPGYNAGVLGERLKSLSDEHATAPAWAASAHAERQSARP
jgi:hypothetical protein